MEVYFIFLIGFINYIEDEIITRPYCADFSWYFCDFVDLSDSWTRVRVHEHTIRDVVFYNHSSYTSFVNSYILTTLILYLSFTKQYIFIILNFEYTKRKKDYRNVVFRYSSI